ncbi:hypothetical protein [Inquilinus limosus]|uniref:Uncharacterized protein n=1 Tax=Inquilinus limosus MP06 TaxID=1398085 RepID=A0A0A0D0M4_9PROT|nr:hypothetical protein [Inquilinus limosus]KGM31363.1 hypothetical protein P409_27635 [Inquilinus limosus MP06]
MDKNVLTDYLESKPTFLRLSEEIELIGLMMGRSFDWLKENERAFLAAVDVLSDSHTIGSAYMDETKEDDKVFFEFCRWLNEVEKKTGIAVSRYEDSFSPDALGLDEFRKAREK